MLQKIFISFLNDMVNLHSDTSLCTLITDEKTQFKLSEGVLFTHSLQVIKSGWALRCIPPSETLPNRPLSAECACFMTIHLLNFTSAGCRIWQHH